MAGHLGLLTLPVAAWLTLLSLLSYICIGAIVNQRKLRQFQGPPAAGFSRFWLFWQSCRARLSTAEFEAIRRYGSVCRIGPNLLVTDDADIVRHMNAPGSRWRRSEWYNGVKLDPRFDTVFSTRDEKIHADLRARESGGYNGRDIDTLEPDIDSCVVDFMDLIRVSYSGTAVDFAMITRFFTLDLLSTVAFGRPFGFMAANQDLWDYNKTSSQSMLILEWSVNHALLRWLFSTRVMQALAAPKVTDKTGLGPALAFAHKAVAERFGTNPKIKHDMLGHFIGKGLTQLQCEVEAYLQIIAGSDSTTTVLRSALFLLVGSPVAYGKLRAEIDTAVRDGLISYPVMSYSEAVKLPYLQACIWESLRMYPPLFGLKSKLAPRGGETVKGIYFPEGVELAVCDDALCRRKEVFGEDSHIFRPDRWIEASPEARVKYRQTVDTVFGSGRYQCLGRHIAMMELHKALAELMRNFDWAMADPMRGIDQQLHAVHIQSNMNLIAVPRV